MRCCARSRGQSDRRFEVVVADDGSGPRTAALIERWKPRLGVPLAHVWHEHRDFRAGEIRNRAIRASRGDYCVFPRRRLRGAARFHRHAPPSGRAGLVRHRQSRAAVAAADAGGAAAARSQPQSWTLATWLQQRLQGGLNRLSPVLRLPLGPLRKLGPRAWQGARSCNLAVWRSDLDRVDGFDATFSGWGREDSDLLVRLLHAGVRRKDGDFATGVLSPVAPRRRSFASASE